MKIIILAICAILFFGVDAFGVDPDENSNEYTDVEDSSEALLIPGSLQCKLCEEVIRKVRKEIGRESSRENIKRVLKKVCTVVPSKSFRRKCSERVDKDGDRLVDMLVKEQSGKIICAAMGFCAVSVNDYSDENELLSSDEFFSIQCVLCGKVMKKVKKEIGRESSREHIKDVLKKACSIVPDRRFRRKCVERVEKDGDHIVDMLVNDATAKAICIYFGFC